tara:strand:+ start:394 stop:897 length:504 start_codon:yes stop_codon:yes gene_type:complete
MKLLDASALSQALRTRAKEYRLSGAELGRILGVGRAQGANLMAGRNTTTLRNTYKWANAVGYELRMLAFEKDDEQHTIRLLEIISDLNARGLERISVFLADDIDLLLKVSNLPRTRLKLLREFLFVLRYCNDTDLKVWEYQLAAHVEAIDSRMAPAGQQDLTNGGSR